MKDETKFKEFMAGLCELFDKKISTVLTSMYWKALETVSDKEAEKGFSLAFTKCEFFPKPVELLALMNNKPAVEDLALTVAHDIVSHLKIYGLTKLPNLSGDDIAIHLMTKRWPYKAWASEVLESELKWWVKEFSEAYRAYTETEAPIQIEAPRKVKELTENMFEPTEQTGG